MLTLGLTLTMLALIALPLALRARITARGTFCRRCRFDLHGITLDPSARCPECGASLDKPRPTLRRPSAPAVALTILALLAGLSLTTLGIGRNTARIMAALPDRAAHTLSELGLDAALTDIATNRLTRVPPLPERIWDDLIADAMAHLANPAKPWDPNHGEVLGVAMTTGRLNMDQMEACFDAMITHGVQLPEQVRHGVPKFSILAFHANKGHMRSVNNLGDVMHDGESLFVKLSITEITIPGHAFIQTPTTSIGLSGMHFPHISFGGYRSHIGSVLDLTHFDWSKVEPNTDLPVRVAYTVTVQPMDGDPVYYSRDAVDEQTVRILHPDASIVRLNTDHAPAFAAGSLVRIRPLHILPPEGRSTHAQRGTTIARSGFNYANAPVSVAGTVVAIHQGREIPMGLFSQTMQANSYGSTSISWVIPPDQSIDEAVIQSMIEAGKVTIEIRPDPSVAESSVDIREILGVTLRFENVPIATTESTNRGASDQPNPDDTTGRPVLPTPTTQPD
jgi:hypothetical protein